MTQFKEQMPELYAKCSALGAEASMYGIKLNTMSREDLIVCLVLLNDARIKEREERKDINAS